VALRLLDLRRVDEIEQHEAVEHGLDDVDVRTDAPGGVRASLQHGNKPTLCAREEGVDEPCRGLARASRRVERGRHLRPEREVLAEAVPDAFRDGDPPGGRLPFEAFLILDAEVGPGWLLHGLWHGSLPPSFTSGRGSRNRDSHSSSSEGAGLDKVDPASFRPSGVPRTAGPPRRTPVGSGHVPQSWARRSDPTGGGTLARSVNTGSS